LTLSHRARKACGSASSVNSLHSHGGPASRLTDALLWGTIPIVFRLSPAERRRIYRLLPVVCPSAATARGVGGPIVEQVERLLASYPAPLRRALLLALWMLNGDRWERAWEARSGAVRMLVRSWKAVLVLAYYVIGPGGPWLRPGGVDQGACAGAGRPVGG
jgi:hypothetical protein